MEKVTITLKTLFGVEQVLKEELEELGYEQVVLLNRAVQLKGNWEDVYFLNLHTRCALSILVEITQFRIREEKDLYKQAMKINWTEFFTIDKSFAVKGAIHSKVFSHSQYPFLLVKDAIVDRFKQEQGDRPDVNLKNPQLVFDLYVKDNLVTISLNTSGAPLYQRGYRQETGLAPINEVLAAAMIRMSGWDRKSTFYDPFCGSGTFLIEAALLAANIPSCIERQHFAFKNFKNYIPELWEGIQHKANKMCKGFDFDILGSDADADMIFKTKRNFRALPVGRFIKLSVNSFAEQVDLNLTPGVLMCNPPYGERLHYKDNQTEIEELYEELGTWFKKEMTGFSCWVISSNEDALKCIGLKPSRKVKLFNGDLECSFREYQMFQGSHKEKVLNSLKEE